jgi:hypothetical protein
MIKNIQIIKLFAWENFFEEKINDVRGKEVEKLKKKELFGCKKFFF